VLDPERPVKEADIALDRYKRKAPARWPGLCCLKDVADD
jgi:hypothetical protein